MADDNSHRPAPMKDFPIAGTDGIGGTDLCRLTSADVSAFDTALRKSTRLVHGGEHASPTTLKQIQEEVCLKHNISLREMLSDRRAAPLAIARHEAFYRAYNETAMTLPAIGKAFNRDHSSVLSGIRRHKERTGS